jgi:hypothetical protein
VIFERKYPEAGKNAGMTICRPQATLCHADAINKSTEKLRTKEKSFIIELHELSRTNTKQPVAAIHII